MRSATAARGSLPSGRSRPMSTATSSTCRVDCALSTPLDTRVGTARCWRRAPACCSPGTPSPRSASSAGKLDPSSCRSTRTPSWHGAPFRVSRGCPPARSSWGTACLSRAHPPRPSSAPARTLECCAPAAAPAANDVHHRPALDAPATTEPGWHGDSGAGRPGLCGHHPGPEEDVQLGPQPARGSHPVVDPEAEPPHPLAGLHLEHHLGVALEMLEDRLQLLDQGRPEVGGIDAKRERLECSAGGGRGDPRPVGLEALGLLHHQLRLAP